MKSKVIPIKGRHETLHSMLGQAMGDTELKSGIIFTFDADSVMSFGQVKMTRSQTCMAAVACLSEALFAMNQPDENDK